MIPSSEKSCYISMPWPKLSVCCGFSVEDINGLERARTCFPNVGRKLCYASVSIPAKPHFPSVTSSLSPQDKSLPGFWGCWHWASSRGEQRICCCWENNGPLLPARCHRPFLMGLRSGMSFVAPGALSKREEGLILVWLDPSRSSVHWAFRRYS